MRSLLTIASLAVLATVASGANAATAIDVQFSGNSGYQQTGAAVVGKAGDVWNDFIGNSGGSVLVDTGGALSSVSLSFSSYGAYEADPGYTQFTGTPYANLMQGYLYGFTDTQATDLKFSGLTAGKEYGFWVYTQGDDNSGGRSISLTANGGSAQVSTQTNASTFVLGDNYVYLTAIASAAGVVDLVGRDLVAEGDINGVQVMAVPEPSTVVLMMAGFAFLAGAVIRRSRVR